MEEQIFVNVENAGGLLGIEEAVACVTGLGRWRATMGAHGRRRRR